MAVSQNQQRARFNQALQLCQNGAFDHAEELCRAILAADARHADAWNMLAATLQQLGRLDEASTSAARATDLRPDIPPYWLTRGNAELALGEFAAAEESLKRASRLAPAFAEAHFRLGLCRAAVGRFSEAIVAYGEALRLAPDVAEIHYRIAQALMNLCRWDAAMASFQEAFLRDPGVTLDRHPGMVCMRYLQFQSVPEFWQRELIRFFQREDINKSRHVEIGVRAVKAQPAIRHAIDLAKSGVLLQDMPPSVVRDITDDAFLQLLLCEVVIPDAGMERLLRAIRSELLLDQNLCTNTPLGFLCALAAQCFNNEFVYAEDPTETAAIEILLDKMVASLNAGSGSPDPRQVALLAMYRPIHDLPDMEAFARGIVDPAMTSLLKRTVRNVLAERAERHLIAQVEEIRDETSRTVRKMYEENPYPRWFSIDRFPPVSLDEWIAKEAPRSNSSKGHGGQVRILVAGCGTGKEACELAVNISAAQVLAVDLSLSSLAYAKRTARELGIDNIEFRQADLLLLEATGGYFDLVSSSGVLHHMKQPEAGLQALARQLRPGGLCGLRSTASGRVRWSMRRALMSRSMASPPRRHQSGIFGSTSIVFPIMRR